MRDIRPEELGVSIPQGFSLMEGSDSLIYLFSGSDLVGTFDRTFISVHLSSVVYTIHCG
jgi:hypothetical protein